MGFSLRERLSAARGLAPSSGSSLPDFLWGTPVLPGSLCHFGGGDTAAPTHPTSQSKSGHTSLAWPVSTVHDSQTVVTCSKSGPVTHVQGTTIHPGMLWTNIEERKSSFSLAYYGGSPLANTGERMLEDEALEEGN